VTKFAGKNQLCDVTYGASACDGVDYECVGSDGSKLRGSMTFGICSRTPGGEARQGGNGGEGDSCQGERGCDKGLVCYSSNGATSDRGICTRVTKFAGKNQLCDVTYGASACDGVDYECVGSDGSKLRGSVTFGICSRTSGGEGDSCRIEEYLNSNQGCVGGLVCYSHDGATFGVGICTNIGRYAGKNQACDASFGADACVDVGYVCLGSNGFELRGVGMGLCTSTLAPKKAVEVTQPRTGSDRQGWYVNYSLGAEGRCVMNCNDNQGQHCGSGAEKWQDTFDTAEMCCETKLWWMNRSQCVPGMF